MSIIQPGGMPGIPVMTGITRATNGVKVAWDGPSGYYQLFQKLGLKDPKWQPVSGPNPNRNATITALSGNAFFRVSGPQPQYAGAQTCAECHENTHTAVMETRHTGAFTNASFVAQGGQTNASCLPCHTVGYGLPSGFVSKSKTPQLGGVQCENCHGPAGNHAANENDPTVRPRLELAAQVCGGCHNAGFVPAQAAASHPPYYEEWNRSAHRAVLPELKADFAGDPKSSGSIPNCGHCHSGSVREAFLEKAPMPDGQEAGAVGIVCATCHDAHEKFVWTNVLSGVVYTNQLRNPVSSTNDYFLATSDVFTNKYDPDVNICAQCHNHRGASWSSTSRPPHHSPQYNMLLGTVGMLETGATPNQPGSHALLIDKQCVGCHMQTSAYVSPQQPAVAGHTFGMNSYEVCAKCHKDAANAEMLAGFVQGIVTNSMQATKASLDRWATTKAPDSLRTRYGVLAWEYTNPGDLSTGGPGPNTAEQALIPTNIKKARFNLYLTLYDGSYGVHNPLYTLDILNAAQTWVQQELSK